MDLGLNEASTSSSSLYSRTKIGIHIVSPTSISIEIIFSYITPSNIKIGFPLDNLSWICSNKSYFYKTSVKKYMN